MTLVSIILALTITTPIVFGQQRTIKGRLIDPVDSMALPGWNVVEYGTANGTVTNVNGEFTLTVGSGPTIIWFPQCFTQLYVEYGEEDNFKEVTLAMHVKGQMDGDSKKVQRKLARILPTRELKGDVIDKKTRQPLKNCEIKLKGTDNIVYSNDKGSFSITVPNNKRIELEITKDETLQLVIYDVDVNFKRIKLTKDKKANRP